MLDVPTVRLTSLAHGGGCGCKLAPSVLQDLLAGQAQGGPFERLLVGTETGDDAAVWDLDGGTAIIATTDFFMPMVDDPDHFGRIAATNAISDIYAMGGTPLMALAILGMPLGKVDIATVRAILGGGAAICAEAGIPVAGGHSIDCPEPVYGLAVIGSAPRGRIRRNSTAQPGDALILTKALGVGVYSAAFKKEALGKTAYDEMLASVTRLNRIGTELAQDEAVHAITDVTGFGILGHGLEMARGSGATLRLSRTALPWLSEAESLVQQGFVTGASHRNWASYGHEVDLPEGAAEWQRHLLTDPQTSGGLLVACAPEAADRLLAAIHAAGYAAAARIGTVEAGPGRVVVEG
ncbi:UNVERIFIED_ORG: selenide,water dikinase [Xanthobacter viscosus]|uniref:Selenide, water dikinase n=1 Tax=Xanthobacter autotrophicus TaxID=280 RepID=A0A6C1K8Z9_XANAU|nr:selenide, water dikinase SelD [Xanthobacter autotrophicus]TLX40748.1 selenide, water dikinase SelD [Xanthobacter autotrophicus]